MTEKLYEKDSYIREFTARVMVCRPGKDCYEVILDRTAFFPEGGGQNADRGSLTELPVLDVQIRDGELIHEVSAPLPQGSSVTGRLNWEMRFSNMQQHSGEHIFSGLTNRYYGYNNVGFHLGSQMVTMDFDGILAREDIDRLEWETNQVISENQKITAIFPTAEELGGWQYRSKIEIEGQVRLVQIKDYDVCACCAPHVARTGEIGLFKVINFEKYKAGTRVYMLCGFRALADYRVRQTNTEEISVLLSVKPELAAAGVKRLQDENTRLRGELFSLQEELIVNEAAQIPPDTQNIYLFKAPMDAAVMRKLVNLCLEKVSEFAGVFSGDETLGYHFIIGSRTKDARLLVNALKEKFGARGGGSAQMVQGSVAATSAELEGLLEQEAR